MKQKKINIGLFGFGTVGKGLYDVLQRIRPQNVKIVSVCVEDITKNAMPTFRSPIVPTIFLTIRTSIS